MDIYAACKAAPRAIEETEREKETEMALRDWNMRKLFLAYWGRSVVKGHLFILIFSAVLLIISLAGVIVAYTALPAEVEQETALLIYEHEGRFDYLV